MAWSDCLASDCCGKDRSRTKFYTCRSSSMGTRSCASDERLHEDDDIDGFVEVAHEAIDEPFVFLQEPASTFRIQDPAVPYYGELKAALSACNAIIIEGAVDCIATRVSVNLACGEGPTCDLAFHLNPRFDQNYVVRNCRLSGRWGEEEGSVPYRSPFARGAPFHICIFISDDAFLVSVNGRHFCAYTFRVPLHRVTRIEIQGDVTISLIEHKPVHNYPELGPLVKQSILNVPLSANIDCHAVLHKPSKWAQHLASSKDPSPCEPPVSDWFWMLGDHQYLEMWAVGIRGEGEGPSVPTRP